MTIKHLGGIFGRNPTFNDVTVDGGIYIGGDAAGNLLDDYEEGTWTPAPADAISGGNIGTFGSRRGIYTKIGNIVVVHCTIININTSGLTSSNNFYIQGLPYTPTSYTGPNMLFVGSCAVSNASFSGSLVARATDNEAAVSVNKSTSGSGISQILVSDISSGVSDIYFSLIYEAS